MESGIFILLGSNLNDPIYQLTSARKKIAQRVGTLTVCSSLYKTAPWGLDNQPPFYNQVVSLDTDLAPAALLRALQQIENDMGRVRKVRWGPRIIDLDILFYHDQIIDTDFLKLPHPSIPQRNFTLVPLAEIASELVHPILKKKIATLLEECGDLAAVEKV